MSFGGPLLLAPLSSLLGIRPGMHVSVLSPAPGFMEKLLPLPEGVALTDTAKLGLDVIVVFARKKTELVQRLPDLVRKLSVTGGIWVVFPSITDDIHSLSEDFVRLLGLEIGLHDTKRLPLDPAWTGLKLQVRPRSPRPELPRAQA